MGTAERRREIIKILCRRRHETLSNLASEFDVSERTIQRDIVALSSSFPLYTRSGKYGGGVYVLDGFVMERMYMSKKEISLLQKLYFVAANNPSLLNACELALLQSIISQYTQPTTSRERKTS